ncbi:MAG: glycosyltransferase family 4 protein [Gemmatimonadota bacterium]|nr:glycosyltransferase family 4 protein [Gemmatimonadota bacterium]MDH5551461.1 glycosyltransferase family 4 protein [Gemmatimonadota bacterium]
MRVLVLATHPFYQERGTPIRLRCMIEALTARDDEATVLTIPEGEDLEAPGVTTVRVARIPGLTGIRPGFSAKKLLYDAAILWRAIRMLRKERWDVIHAVEESAFLAIMLKALYGVPFIFDMHSSVAQQMQERFPWLRVFKGALDACERAAVRRSCGVIAVSNVINDRVRAFDQLKPVVTVEDAVLFNGQSPAEGEQVRATIGRNGPIVMYVGNFEHYQGIDLLLEAFPHTLSRIPDAQLVLIGGLPEDIERYRNRAREIGIHEETHFVGPRPVELLGWYLRQADVLVSPRTKGHNTPMKLYSYLAAGRPLVATKLSTHTQVLNDEVACLAAPEPAAFGESIGDLLLDGQRGQQLAERAGVLAEREYSIAAFRRKLYRLYDQATARSHGY